MNMRYKKIDGEVYYKLFEGDSKWGTDNPFPLLKDMVDGYNPKEYRGEIVEPKKKKKAK